MDDRQCTESIGVPLARKLTKDRIRTSTLAAYGAGSIHICSKHTITLHPEPPPPRAAKAIENEDNLSIEELKDKYLLLNIKRNCGLCGTATSGISARTALLFCNYWTPKARKSLIASVSAPQAAIISKFYSGKTGCISVPAKDGPFRAV